MRSWSWSCHRTFVSSAINDEPGHIALKDCLGVKCSTILHIPPNTKKRRDTQSSPHRMYWGVVRFLGSFPLSHMQDSITCACFHSIPAFDALVARLGIINRWNALVVQLHDAENVRLHADCTRANACQYAMLTMRLPGLKDGAAWARFA